MKNTNKMDELEKNVPDDFWRKAFDEAAETPPKRVWDSIERRLDESNGPKVIPLWGSGLASSRPLIWGTGIAAALALLLVGWWVVQTQSTSPSISRIQPSSPTEDVAVVPVRPKKSAGSKPADQPGEAIASVSQSPTPSKESLAGSVSQLSARSVGGDKEVYVAQNVAKSDDKSRLLRTQPMMMTTTTLRAASPGAVIPNVPALPTSQMAITSFAADQNPAQAGISLTKTEAVAYQQLNGKPLRFRSLGPIQRIVWYQPAELALEPELTKEKRITREKWASVSAMPGAFNPMVSMASAQPAASNAFTSLSAPASNANQGAVNSRANFSVAYQASAGVQLSERWSVESGVGYLAGHATVEAPTRSVATAYVQGVSANRMAVASNLYVDALQNNSSNKIASPAGLDLMATNNVYLSSGNYNSQVQQTLTNDYQYVQVPIQLGYQLRPRKRLSLAVLGGLLTNIFVRNTVGNDVVITAKDGVYRPISLAATMGARFRYRPSGRWSASLAGLYQPSLELGTQPDSQVQSRPTSSGMSFGVDYHF